MSAPQRRRGDRRGLGKTLRAAAQTPSVGNRKNVLGGRHAPHATSASPSSSAFFAYLKPSSGRYVGAQTSRIGSRGWDSASTSGLAATNAAISPREKTNRRPNRNPWGWCSRGADVAEFHRLRHLFGRPTSREIIVLHGIGALTKQGVCVGLTCPDWSRRCTWVAQDEAAVLLRDCVSKYGLLKVLGGVVSTF